MKDNVSAINFIGETIRRCRIERGLSQGDVENATGLQRSYISRVEGGFTQPALENLQKFATAFGLTLGELLAGGETETQSQLSDQQLAFLRAMKQFAPQLTQSDRTLVITMLKKLASTQPARGEDQAALVMAARG